ncbi:hypothetical protein [Aeromonas phage Riv-10]|nr:hypothetical protein [Aeromonas phage Riv-10]
MKIRLIDEKGFIDHCRKNIVDYKLARSIVDFAKTRELQIVQRDRGMWTLNVYGPLGKAQICCDQQKFFEVNQ